MTDNIISKEVFEHSQQALDYLKQYNISPEPRCYEIFFQYCSNENPEVTKAIDDYLAKGNIPDKEYILKLHSILLSYDNIARTVDSVSVMLNDQIVGMTDSIAGTDAELSSFSDLLVGVSDDIDTGVFTSDLASKLSMAVEKVNSKIKDLESDLDNSQIEIKKLQNYLDTVRQESNIDPLTGLFTRKRYDQGLSQSVRSAIETEEEMCIAFFEVDYYDSFRNKWGQTTAEQILRFIGSALKENTKGRDISARYSATVFALVLPKTGLEGAKILADHIRNTVERKRIVKKTTGEFLGRVTLSVGIARYNKGESIGFFSARCDRALLAARSNGRNCTVTEIEAEDILSSNNFESGAA